MPGHAVLFTAGTGVCVLFSEYRSVTEPWAGIHKLSTPSGTVSHSKRKKSPELEDHHTFPSQTSPHHTTEFKNNVLCPTLLHLPSWPVHASLHSCLSHYCTSLATVCSCNGICDDRMQPVYTDTFLVSLPHTASLHWYLSCPFTTHSQFTLIPFLSLYHIQPVYTDTFLVPLPHTASLQWYLSCPITT